MNFNNCLDWLKKIWNRKKKEPEIPQPARRIVDTNAIRARIHAQGWRLMELPIKKKTTDNQCIVARWKLIAVKGDKSIEVGGETIDSAMRLMGSTLGVVARTPTM